MELTGGCHCKAVRYRISAAPLTARVCWCRDCQYLACGSGTTNVMFPKAALEVTGLLADLPGVADSGNLMHRRFCPQCGTHLFSESEARPHLFVVRAGSLDDPSAIRPAATIWTSSAPVWAQFDPQLPQFERQPPPLA